MYYQKPFSTQIQAVSFHKMTSEWLLLSLTRPAQHLSSVAFCYLFILSMVCPSHIPSGDSALPEPSHPGLLRTTARRQFPTSMLAIYLTPAFWTFSTWASKVQHTETGEMTLPVKYDCMMPSNHDDLNPSIPTYHTKILGTVTCDCNLSAREAQAEGAVVSTRAALLVCLVVFPL